MIEILLLGQPSYMRIKKKLNHIIYYIIQRQVGVLAKHFQLLTLMRAEQCPEV